MIGDIYRLLSDGTVERCHVWGGPQSIALTQLADVAVSTIFLGLDQSHTSVPILFETMVFHSCEHLPPGLTEQRRCSTYRDALAQHREMLHQWVTLA